MTIRLFLNQNFITLGAGAVRCLVLNQQKQNETFHRGCYLSCLAIKYTSKEVRRITGHRETLCDRSSTFHLHRLCRLRSLDEMFDFQMNTILPLHHAEAAYHL